MGSSTCQFLIGGKQGSFHAPTLSRIIYQLENVFLRPSLEEIPNPIPQPLERIFPRLCLCITLQTWTYGAEMWGTICEYFWDDDSGESTMLSHELCLFHQTVFYAFYKVLCSEFGDHRRRLTVPVGTMYSLWRSLIRTIFHAVQKIVVLEKCASNIDNSQSVNDEKLRTILW